MHQPNCAGQHDADEPCASKVIPWGKSGAGVYLDDDPSGPVAVPDMRIGTESIDLREAEQFARDFLDLVQLWKAS